MKKKEKKKSQMGLSSKKGLRFTRHINDSVSLLSEF